MSKPRLRVPDSGLFGVYASQSYSCEWEVKLTLAWDQKVSLLYVLDKNVGAAVYNFALDLCAAFGVQLCCVRNVKNASDSCKPLTVGLCTWLPDNHAFLYFIILWWLFLVHAQVEDAEYVKNMIVHYVLAKVLPVDTVSPTPTLQRLLTDFPAATVFVCLPVCESVAKPAALSVPFSSSWLTPSASARASASPTLSGLELLSLASTFKPARALKIGYLPSSFVLRQARYVSLGAMA